MTNAQDSMTHDWRQLLENKRHHLARAHYIVNERYNCQRSHKVHAFEHYIRNRHDQLAKECRILRRAIKDFGVAVEPHHTDNVTRRSLLTELDL